jgi:BirA family biotin operon repressor/biotin-[acetyl-CoA-carboxylase] ligase
MERIELENPFPGASAFLVERTASTQEEAKLLAARGLPPGSLVAADAQSAGRGRFPGRAWESEAGKNLLVTIYLGAPRKALPIRVGLALCEAVSDYASALGAAFPSPPRLKWPNDLMLGDRKAAGILCEASASGPSAGAFAGIGLNCNQRDFPPPLADGATSLARELGREVDRWAILELLLGRLAAGLGTRAGSGDEEGWRQGAERLLWRRGETVRFLPGLAAREGKGAPVEGRLMGLDGDGSILVLREGEAEARVYAAGELTAGPAADNMEA